MSLLLQHGIQILHLSVLEESVALYNKKPPKLTNQLLPSSQSQWSSTFEFSCHRSQRLTTATSQYFKICSINIKFHMSHNFSFCYPTGSVFWSISVSEQHLHSADTGVNIWVQQTPSERPLQTLTQIRRCSRVVAAFICQTKSGQLIAFVCSPETVW